MNVNIKIILTSILIVFTTSCMGVLSSLDKAAKESGLDFLALALTGSGGSQQVDPDNGGVIQAPTMSLTIPIGALNNSETITYSSEAIPEAQNSTVPVQAAYKFGPAGLQFNTAATLEICYDAKDLANKGFQEKTVEIQYVNPDTGKYESIGGDVNYATHCVSANINHFSTFILTAQILAAGSSAPNIGITQFLPSTPIEGLPVHVRTIITKDWNSGANIASVVLYYRTTLSGSAFTSLPMLPDEWDTQSRRYTVKIPGVEITSDGLDYYVEVFDTLNKSRINPATAPTMWNSRLGDISDPATPIRIIPSVNNMAAGFSREMTLQVKGSSSATWFPVIAETSTFLNGRGTVLRTNNTRVKYTAQIFGPSDLQGTYGGLTSAPVSTSMPALQVTPGLLTRIDILYNNVVLPDPFEVDGLDTRDLDAAGYDQFNNFMLILPTFSTTGGIGTVDNTVDYGRFTAAGVTVSTIGNIIATLGGFPPRQYNVLINPIILPNCTFGSSAPGQGFDSSCVFGP